MKASIVIGANWGDEGKGLFTDFLANQDSLVIRFNGGAQAGHTVFLPDGRNHVFHHFGSGALSGVPTFLSKHFICNPIVFQKERNDLIKLNADIRLFVDENALVTTPWDMMINQALEEKRASEVGDDKKHGSCGLGINETVVRSMNPQFRLTVRNLLWGDVRSILKRIKEEYFHNRLKELDMNILSLPYLSTIGIYDRFQEDCQKFCDQIAISNLASLRFFDNFIFEGAQGLQLDEDSSNFPHVTRSKTGIKNAIELVSEVEEKWCTKIVPDIYYLSRTYFTKHGAGPFDGELPKGTLPFSKIQDSTNVFNLYQGTIRYSYLNPKTLCEAVNNDTAGTMHPIKAQIAFTCMDQLDDENKMKFVVDKKLTTTNPWSLLKVVNEKVFNMQPGHYGSFGPTKKDVQKR